MLRSGGVLPTRLSVRLVTRGDLAAGTCHEGWVVIAAPDNGSVHPGSTAIIFDNTKIGFIAEELHL